jgi:hypothetical protein
MAKKVEHPVRPQVEVIPIPFVRQKGHGTLLGAYRCMFCSRVELSERKIIIHLHVEHGIRKCTSQQNAAFIKDI